MVPLDDDGGFNLLLGNLRSDLRQWMGSHFTFLAVFFAVCFAAIGQSVPQASGVMAARMV
jgi:hypothetical protein